MVETERKARAVFLMKRPEIFDELLGRRQEQERVEIGLVDLYERYNTLLNTYGELETVTLSSGGLGSQEGTRVSLPKMSFSAEEGEFTVWVTGLVAGDGISIAINFEGKDGMVNTSTCRLRKGKHQVTGRVGNEPMCNEDIRRYAELADGINFALFWIVGLGKSDSHWELNRHITTLRVS